MYIVMCIDFHGPKRKNEAKNLDKILTCIFSRVYGLLDIDVAEGSRNLLILFSVPYIA